jgi:cytochrome c oxidase assembly protein subunit 15
MEQAEHQVRDDSPKWLRAVAIAAVCCTFPLLVVGGVVTTTRVGMADPEWPTTPWFLVEKVWGGELLDRGIGFAVEHGHRLLGWIVGILTTVLAIGLWFTERRAWLRYLGVVAVVAVIAQGVLGGLRVLFHNQFMALAHGIAAQLFFAFMTCLAAVIVGGAAMESRRVETGSGAKIRRLALITTGLIIAQLVFGATLRHFGPMWALGAHLFMAFAILVHVALIAKRVLSERGLQVALGRPVEILTILVLGQLMLGAGAWGTSRGFGLNLTTTQSGAQIVFATMHMSVGALILATTAFLAVQSYRLLVPASGASSIDSETQRAARSRAQSVGPSVSSLESRELWRTGVTQ